VKDEDIEYAKEMHPYWIDEWFGTQLREKYKRGQEQHGGNVAYKRVLNHITEEVVDTVVYLAVLQEQMQLIADIANYSLTLGRISPEYNNSDEKTRALEAIWNIIKHGNVGGEQEEELEGNPECEDYGSYYYNSTSRRFREWLTK
jgi:hypothetical protein